MKIWDWLTGKDIQNKIKDVEEKRLTAEEEFNPTKEERDFADWFCGRITPGDSFPAIAQNFAAVNSRGLAMWMCREYREWQNKKWK